MCLSNTRVLLVEDNEDLAENVIEILDEEGAYVTHVATGAGARDAAAAGLDVALIDVNLPDSNGLELLRELKLMGDGLHEVLLVTGNATIQDAVDAVKGGAYDYIIKPFRGGELISSVERAIRQVRSSREARALGYAIAQREESLRTLVQTVQALLLVLDTEGRVVQANPAVAEVTGVSPEDMVGVMWTDTYVPPSERLAAHNVFARLIAGESRITHENRVISADRRRERIVSWQSSPLVGPTGLRLVYASGLDVTDLKELESRTRLSERLAAVGTLAAGLAHEIRNPLNSALLQLQLLDRRLRKYGIDEKLMTPVRLVQEEVERLSSLVSEFLDFARPSVLSLGDVDLVEIIHHVIELERPGASEKDIEIELKVSGAPLIVAADRSKLKQVVLNLIRNAIEAVVEAGRVWVEVEACGDGARFTVRDSGPGIAPDAHAHIFEPFFSTKSTGTGLGMAICHSLIAQHGGSISVRSDRGAELSVRLPRTPPV